MRAKSVKRAKTNKYCTRGAAAPSGRAETSTRISSTAVGCTRIAPPLTYQNPLLGSVDAAVVRRSAIA
jgi:hypothetical protein